MMGHLIGLGHRRIAFICGPPRNSDARERLRGYRQCMRQLGVAPQEVAGDFTEVAGHAAALRILETSPRATAIFAANDAMAVGALAALAEVGLDVPGRMAGTGFDDIPIARYVAPPLTTIRVDIAELGGRAFALLHRALTRPGGGDSLTRSGRSDALTRPGRGGALTRPGSDDERRRERISTTLIVRRSCGAQVRQTTVQQTKPSKQPARKLRGPKKGETP